MMHFTIPTLTVGVTIPALSVEGATFGVERWRDWQAIKPEWERVSSLREPSVCQSSCWLTAWYDALAGQAEVEPFPLTVRHLQTGLVALYLPLLRRTVNGVRRVEFADLGRTIYNAPLLGPAAPTEPEAISQMWRDLRSALRGWGADVVNLHKMPVHINGAPNPLALIEPARASSRNGNLITVGDDLDAYRRSIKKLRLARSWRVFTRKTGDSAGGAFRTINTVEETLRLLDTMDEQQAERDHLLGRPALNDVDTAFYRNLVARGIDHGNVVMTALTSGEEVVATALGIRQGAYYAILRISIAGERWSNCSPGRLIVDQTIAALHKEGVRQFDLGTGNDELKRRFGAASVGLTAVTAALTVRAVLLVHAAKCVSGHPRLKSLLRRFV